MAARLPNDLRSACRRCRRNRNRFPEVLAFLTRALYPSLSRFAGQDRDDAEQVARLAIWKALKHSRFDPTRPNEVVARYLITAAERALKTFGRSIKRYRKRANLVGDDVWAAVAATLFVSPKPHGVILPAGHTGGRQTRRLVSRITPRHHGMNGHAAILKAYAVYYGHHGTLTGAHRYIGKRLGVSPAEAARRLAQAAEKARRKKP